MGHGPVSRDVKSGGAQDVKPAAPASLCFSGGPLLSIYLLLFMTNGILLGHLPFHVFHSVWAAITNYGLFLMVLEVGKFKIKAPADLMSDEGLLPHS